MREVIDDRKSPELAIRSKTPSILPQTVSPTNTESLKELAIKFEETKDYEQSLSYYKLYLETNQRLKEEEYNGELALLEQSNEIENQEREIALLQQEKELQELTLARNNEEIENHTRLRNSLIIGSILIASLAIVLYLLYAYKRRLTKN